MSKPRRRLENRRHPAHRPARQRLPPERPGRARDDGTISGPGGLLRHNASRPDACATRDAESRGQARITLRIDDETAARRIVVTPATLTLAPGASQPLKAEVQLANGEINANVVWSSADSTIADVNPTNGVVSALRPGTTSIVAAYALDPTVQGECQVTVTSP